MYRMIKWIGTQMETLEGGRPVQMRIGIPQKKFWSIWRQSKSELIAENYKVFHQVNKAGKKDWFVKQPIQIFDKPEDVKNSIEVEEPMLLPHQPEHLNNLINAFERTDGVIDASDTGTGKTPVAVAVCKHMKLNPAIICPIQVIPQWEKWLKAFGVKPVFIANYEAFKSRGNQFGYIDSRYFPHRILNVFGREYGIENKFDPADYTRTWSDAIKHIKKVIPHIDSMISHFENSYNVKFPRDKCREVNDFKWNIPEGTLMIFDEVHKCKGEWTQNSKMLIGAKNFKTLILSATIAQSPRDMRSIGYVLGLHELYNFNKWTKQFDCFQNSFNGWECTDPIGAMKRISQHIFPVRGSRMRIADIPDFPETQITAEPYQSDVTDEYNKEHTALLERIENLEEMGAKAQEIFTEIIRFRQASELMKVPLFVDMTKNAIDNGLSVALFVNYTETRQALQIALNTLCAIHGQGQSVEEREGHKQSFQHGRSRVIVVMSDAGGTGLDLHDEHGNYQRMAIISPTYNARLFKQVLGRVHRAGAKTKSLQRVVFLSGTIEEAVCKSVNHKLDNISALNDGDLMEEDLFKFNQEEKDDKAE
jgi:superfamily II DNA or RNA helicase